MRLAGPVWMGNNCSQAVAQCVPKALLVQDVTPVTHAKAVKNETELQGMRLVCHGENLAGPNFVALGIVMYAMP